MSLSAVFYFKVLLLSTKISFVYIYRSHYLKTLGIFGINIPNCNKK